MKLSFFLIALLLITTLNCSTNDNNKTKVNQLHDIWALEFINGESFVMDDQTRNYPMIEIYVKEERVHGNTGCNTINGTIKIDGNKIKFSQMIATKMACPGDLEYRLLSAFEVIDNYKMKNLRLFLYEGEKEKLVFRKAD
ncbi:MAG: META domain-containing protein [Ignavibacteriaceae bacterium]